MNTALEATSEDRDLQRFVANHTLMIERFFHGRVVAGQRAGEIPDDQPADDIAKLLLSVAMGLRVLVGFVPTRNCSPASFAPPWRCSIFLGHRAKTPLTKLRRKPLRQAGENNPSNPHHIQFQAEQKVLNRRTFLLALPVLAGGCKMDNFAPLALHVPMEPHSIPPIALGMPR